MPTPLQRWEYLYLTIYTDQANTSLLESQSAVVTSSDGRWNKEEMDLTRASIVDLLDTLGDDGWEMVNCTGGSPTRRTIVPASAFEAMFKRLRQPA